MAFNIVQLMGRLTRDPESKLAASGTTILNFSLAVDGERKEDESNYFDCVAFGKTAEFIQTYFSKGKPILITGTLKQNRWQDKETGANRNKVEIIVNRANFLLSSKGEASTTNSGDITQTTVHAPANPVGGGASDDEPPFAPMYIL